MDRWLHFPETLCGGDLFVKAASSTSVTSIASDLSHVPKMLEPKYHYAQRVLKFP